MKDQSHLDPFHLKSFLAVAETLHFTSAAQTQGVSQSTISQHISRLEETLSTRLLARSTKSVRLTPAGEQLVVLARQLLHCEDEIFSRFRDDAPRGTIRLGVTEDLLLTRFPEVLNSFRAAHPELHITLTVGLSANLARLLDESAIDLMCGMRRFTETHGQRLWSEKLRWYTPNGQPPSCDRSIPLVTFPEGSVTRRLAIEALNRAGQPWHLAFTSDSLTAILGAVRAGYGVTAQPSFLHDHPHVAPCEGPELPPLPEVEFIVSKQHQTAHGPEDLLTETLQTHFAPADHA